MAQKETTAACPAVLIGAEPVRREVTGDLAASTKVLYGIGGMAESIKAYSFGVFLIFFYTTVVGLPGTLVGIAAAIGLVWDALVDPCIGFLSDRTRQPIVRRHGFMLAGAAGSGVAFWAVFAPPAGLPPYELVLWLIATSLLLRTAMSCFAVPYQALGAELTHDYHERTSVAGFRAAAGLAGALTAAGLAFLVFLPGASAATDGRFSRQAYEQMGVGLGAVIALSCLVAVIGTLGNSGRVDRTMAPAMPASTAFRFRSAMLVALQQPAFRRLALSSSLFFLATIINASTAIHYLTFYAGISESRSVAAFQLAFYIGALIGIGSWLALAQKMDKHRLYDGAMLATAVMLASAYFLVGPGRLLGTGNLLLLCAGNGLAGLWASALWVLPASIVADVVDEDELVTGERREGIFFGLASCALQVAAGLALVVTGVLVEHFARIAPGTASQAPQTVERIGVLFGLIPALLVVVAALLMAGFPLTRHRVQAVQAQLARSRQERMAR